MKSKGLYILGISVVLFTVACQPNTDVVPIDFGKDQCAYCKMTISNPKFGAELITDKGRVIKYDAAECMINQLREDSIAYQKLYTVTYDQPKQLIAVENLRFLISPDFRSPMGANLSAHSDITLLDKKYHQSLISWEALMDAL